MTTNLFKEVTSTVKHWYIPMFVGLLFIALGVWSMMRPVESYIGLSILFIIIFLVGGLLDIIFAIVNKNELDHWGWELVNGVFSLIIGIIMAISPGLSMTTLPFYIGFVIMFRSMMAISSSIEMKKYGLSDWGYMLVMGMLGVVFSFILLWNPLFAGLTIVIWAGIALFTIGIYSIYFSIKLKSLHKVANDIVK